MNHSQNINYNCIQNSGDDHSEFHAICYNLLPIYTKKKKSPFNFHPLAIQAQGCKETKTQSSLKKFMDKTIPANVSKTSQNYNVFLTQVPILKTTFHFITFILNLNLSLISLFLCIKSSMVFIIFFLLLLSLTM